MSECNNPELGALLHGFELNALSEEDRDRFRTNEDHYHIVEVLTAIFVFDKEYSSDVLSLRKNHEDWDVWGSKRSFKELEALVDELLDDGQS